MGIKAQTKYMFKVLWQNNYVRTFVFVLFIAIIGILFGEPLSFGETMILVFLLGSRR